MSKLPEPPKRPTAVNLRVLAKKTVRKIPYILNYGIDMVDDPLAEGNFSVLLAPLKSSHHINYVSKFGISLEQAVGQIMYVLSMRESRSEYFAANDKAIAEGKEPLDLSKAPQLELDSIDNVKTPFGVMYTSVDVAIMQLVAYILSCGGEIVGKEQTGAWILAEISPEVILDYLEPSSLTEPFEDGMSMFMEVLDVAGLFNLDRVEEDMAKNKEVTDDDLKNSPSNSVEDSSGNEQ